MTQFAVYRNPNPESSAAYPLLLDVQTDLLAELATRVVVPLCRPALMKGQLLSTLTPTFEIENDRYVMLTPQLAGIPVKQLGAHVADLVPYRQEILATLDLLITGI